MCFEYCLNRMGFRHIGHVWDDSTFVFVNHFWIQELWYICPHFNCVIGSLSFLLIITLRFNLSIDEDSGKREEMQIGHSLHISFIRKEKQGFFNWQTSFKIKWVSYCYVPARITKGPKKPGMFTIRPAMPFAPGILRQVLTSSSGKLGRFMSIQLGEIVGLLRMNRVGLGGCLRHAPCWHVVRQSNFKLGDHLVDSPPFGLSDISKDCTSLIPECGDVVGGMVFADAQYMFTTSSCTRPQCLLNETQLACALTSRTHSCWPWDGDVGCVVWYYML